MGTVTEQHRAVAMHAMKIMGGDARPKVQAFHDDRRQRSVDILTTLNAPEAGLKSISSIGLSDFALRHSNGRELETRVELDLARVDHWVKNGAQPTEKVRNLIKEASKSQAAAA